MQRVAVGWFGSRPIGALGFAVPVLRGVARFASGSGLGWLAVTVAAMLALPGLGSEVNSDPSLFLPATAPSVQAAALAAPLQGSVTKSKVTIVAARSSGPLTAADLAAASRVAAWPVRSAVCSRPGPARSPRTGTRPRST